MQLSWREMGKEVRRSSVSGDSIGLGGQEWHSLMVGLMLTIDEW